MPLTLGLRKARVIGEFFNGEVGVAPQRFLDGLLGFCLPAQNRQARGALRPGVLAVIVGCLTLHHLERILVAAGHEISIAERSASPRLVVRVEPDSAVRQFRAQRGLAKGTRPTKVIGEDPSGTRIEAQSNIKLVLSSDQITL